MVTDKDTIRQDVILMAGDILIRCEAEGHYSITEIAEGGGECEHLLVEDIPAEIKGPFTDRDAGIIYNLDDIAQGY